MTSPAELEQLEQLARSGATGPWMCEQVLSLLAERRELVALATLVKEFVETVEHADRCMAARGKGGQQVPYMGDFASAVPSVMSRLKWWARAFDAKLAALVEGK